MSNGSTPAINTRKNALAMPLWDPTLLWYAKAVGEMKKRKLNDPAAWKYQAAIHGYTLDPRLGASAIWQQWIHNEPLPSATQQATFWAQCQHGSWFFLPWHRMYLGYFERIVRATVVSLGGPADWALPYWNYQQGKNSRKLPRAFTEATLPDGSSNPLLEPLRENGNDGKPFIPAQDVDLKGAFGEHEFAGGPGGTQGFGGPVTKFNHSHGNHGALETAPHDQVHGDIGQLMGDPNTAGYDPIFWLHHANIDRLWEMWRQAAPANQNPPANSKWQSFPFKFNDGSGGVPTLTPHDVLDSKAAPFYYQYDDTTPPAGLTAAPHLAMAAKPEEATPMAEKPLPEMVGATSKPIPLTSVATTQKVKLFAQNSPRAMLGAAETHFQRAFLHLENVRGKGQPSSYDVYLNVPEGAKEPAESLLVGTLPTFGLEHASIATERHPGNGLGFTFNITDTVNALKSKKQWHPEELRVTFVPRKKLPRGAGIEVGRISLYFA